MALLASNDDGDEGIQKRVSYISTLQDNWRHKPTMQRPTTSLGKSPKNILLDTFLRLYTIPLCHQWRISQSKLAAAPRLHDCNFIPFRSDIKYGRWILLTSVDYRGVNSLPGGKHFLDSFQQNAYHKLLCHVWYLMESQKSQTSEKPKMNLMLLVGVGLLQSYRFGQQFLHKCVLSGAAMRCNHSYW